MRDDFLAAVRTQCAARAGHVCSNPACRQPTSGPSESDKIVTNVGVAAHISAASPEGPRFDLRLSTEERRSLDNAVWLCQRCAKAVDDDPATYTVSTLRRWRSDAEAAARAAIESGPRSEAAPTVNAAVYFGPNAVSISGPNAVVLAPGAVQIHGPAVQGSPAASASRESIAQRASRIQEELDFKTRRDAFRFQGGGTVAAGASFGLLARGIAAHIETINEASSLNLTAVTQPRTVMVTGLGSLYMGVTWNERYVNSLDESWLEVFVGKSTRWGAAPKFLTREIFDFDLFPSGEGLWHRRGNEANGMTPDGLAEIALGIYLDHANHRR
jgi:hypothetical protein